MGKALGILMYTWVRIGHREMQEEWDALVAGSDSKG